MTVAFDTLNALPPLFEKRLFDANECGPQFAHHLAHVAPENWIAMELAYVVNGGNVPGLSKYAAILEHGRVDLTLVPHDQFVSPVLPENSLRIELKIADTGYWTPAWQQAARDLGTLPRTFGRPKPNADIAVVVAVHAQGEPSERSRAATRDHRQALWESLPEAPGAFTPCDGLRFSMVSPAPVHQLTWPRPVLGKWRRFDAKCRVLWLTRPGDR